MSLYLSFSYSLSYNLCTQFTSFIGFYSATNLVYIYVKISSCLYYYISLSLSLSLDLSLSLSAHNSPHVVVSIVRLIGEVWS